MALEPAGLPFRKLEDAKHDYDAIVFCPVCRSTEVQIVRTNTSHWNMVTST